MNRLFLFLTKIFYGKETIEMLIHVLATLIVQGKWTIERVPESIREAVREEVALLID